MTSPRDPSPSTTVDGLTLRPLRAEDEAQVRAMQRELAADGFDVLMGRADDRWEQVRADFAREAAGDVDPGWVPASFLVAEDEDGNLVGRVSIRWELNDALRHVNGHTGYCVRPGFRRRGHASRMLLGALRLLGERGVASALVTCGVDNSGSAAVIRACGGVERDVVLTRADGNPHGPRTRRFDVPTTARASA